ncbi:MAG: hypothetical protein ABI661_06940 [Gammaproteobacteria bacterium]
MSFPSPAPALPDGALLQKYRLAGAYTDCFVTDITTRATQAEYVEAFYTSPVFRIERWLLARFVARPSTDLEARELALGTRNSFAAWTVEARDANQLLLADFQGRTRSWLMSTHIPGEPGTRLYFGSAVVPAADRRTGEARMGLVFRLLLGFHKLYSRVLLSGAARRLTASH